MAIQLNFEWDPVKAKANFKKHGVSFEQATSVFRDARAVSIFDEEHDEQEDRWATLGMSDRGSILVVFHTYQEVTGEESVTIRIISARRATRKERTQYEVSL